MLRAMDPVANPGKRNSLRLHSFDLSTKTESKSELQHKLLTLTTLSISFKVIRLSSIIL